MPASTCAVDVEDTEYVVHASGPLLARLYVPRSSGVRAAAVSVHGGVWTRETRLTNAVIDQAVAESGVVVMAIDFRMPPLARYPEPIADINLAVRWLKQRAYSFGSRPDLVGGIGTSSGGHQLMLNAMRPHDPRYAARPLPAGSEFDACLAYAVVGWPVVDPLARYRMAKAKNMESHLAGHHAYWPDEDAMAEGSPHLILERGERVELPPTLLLQGTDDAALPPDMADNFAAAFRRAGGDLVLRKFEGQGHTFITKDPTSAASVEAVEIIKDFVRSCVANGVATR